MSKFDRIYDHVIIGELMRMSSHDRKKRITEMLKHNRHKLTMRLLERLCFTEDALRAAEEKKDAALEEITKKALRVEALETALREAQAQVQFFVGAEAAYSEEKIACIEEIARHARGLEAMQKLMDAQQQATDAMIALTRDGFPVAAK